MSEQDALLLSVIHILSRKQPLLVLAIDLQDTRQLFLV